MSQCYCPEDTWGTDQGPVCEIPEFDDALGICFNCNHNRQCHADYWEMFGELYTEQHGNTASNTSVKR